MNDATKVTIGLGMIWGLFAGGYVLLSSFTLGENDTTPEVIALMLYGLTILPTCFLAIWLRRPAGLWLVCLSAISLFGFAYQAVAAGHYEAHLQFVESLLWMLLLCGIPGLLGYLLLRSSTAVKRSRFGASLDG